MAECTYQSGDLVFAQGAASEHVYVIKSGVVEIVRRDESGEHVLAELSEGQVFGEMAAIAAQPHSASARAASLLIVDAIPAARFLDRLSGKPDVALGVLRALVERLRATNLLLTAAGFDAKPIHWAEMRLRPLTGAGAIQMPSGGLVIRNLPFRVGRQASRHGHGRTDPVHLLLKDDELGLVAPDHFVIEDGVMGPILRDCGTPHGTIVNGIHLGGKHRHLSTPLHLGINRIIIGTPGSLFQFELSVHERETPPPSHS